MKGLVIVTGCGAALLAIALPLVLALAALTAVLRGASGLDAAAACGDATQQAAIAAWAAMQAGFSGDDLVTAVAIAGAESGYDNRSSTANGRLRGLWQIDAGDTGLNVRGADLFDPVVNARAAYSLWMSNAWGHRDWRLWDVYWEDIASHKGPGQGPYTTHRREAQLAVTRVVQALPGSANSTPSSSSAQPSAVALASTAAGQGEPCGGQIAGVVPGTPIVCSTLAVARGFQLPIHSGIDLDCPAQTPVIAVSAGVVHRRSDFAGSCLLDGRRLSGGYGNLAVLGGSSTGLEYYYGHLTSFAVADGAGVRPGDVIGYEGTTGCSTGPHLHFEVRVNGKPANPCPYLAKGYPSVQWQVRGCPLYL